MTIYTCPNCMRDHNIPGQVNTVTCVCGRILKKRVFYDGTKVESIPMDQPPLLQQRHSTHGRFEDNAQATELLMEVLRATPNYKDAPDTVKVASFMIVHKLARAFSGDLLFDDHWKDIAGYATLIVNSIKQDTCKTTSQPTHPTTVLP